MMNEITIIQEYSLPSLIDRAAAALSGARTSAEVLDAKHLASAAYDAAKRTLRLAKAKQAHDELIQAVYRAQADALEIEAGAKRRLADEYDSAQERGEVASHGGARNFNIPDENLETTVANLGLTSKDIHEARQLRDAEAAEPGITRRTLDERIARGEEPSKAALRQAVIEAAERGLRPEARGSRKNPWHRPDPQYDAAAAVGGACRRILDQGTPEFVAGGWVDQFDRQRSLDEIRQCRDFLNRVLEYADVKHTPS